MQTAAQILDVREKNAGSLFPGDAGSVKKAFRRLARAWHPDRNSDPKAGEVFAHLTVLKAAALRMTGNPSARTAGTERVYREPEGRAFRFRYMSLRQGDLGDVLIGRDSIAYEADKAFADVAEAEAARIGSFRFADAGMRKEIERFLPQLKASIASADRRVNVLSRPADTVLLADLVDHFGGRIPAVHAAWIVSGMMNLACYLHWSGLTHGAISTTTVLVCPAYHSVILAGGWGFSTAYGKRPSALPERTTSIMPRLALKGEVVGPSVDLQLVRATGQDILGCPGGGGLAMSSDVPKAMAQWLIMPPLEDAYRDYAGWTRCLAESYGKRRFVQMGVTPQDIYGN